MDEDEDDTIDYMLLVSTLTFIRFHSCDWILRLARSRAAIQAPVQKIPD